MTARPIVFAGPSLYGRDAPATTGLDLRPPAGRGSILAAAHEQPPAIGLIDGLFETEPSVWHKEILYALSIGVPVFGAASLGALRAVECAPFGMTGVGGIFREYVDGTRTADADVGVMHAPAELGYQPLSVALVDAEATLAAMLGAHEIDRQMYAHALDRARNLHFKQRSWEAIFDDAALVERASARPSRKTADAAELLAVLRRGRFAAPPPFELNLTGYLTGLAHELGISLRSC